MKINEYDFIIIGSGFGGSVSALRLSEKGYSVLVLEKGKEFKDTDFPKTNWSLRKFLWLPFLRCFGILKMTLFKHVFILSGTGVGGGSLVYANTLLVPKDEVWNKNELSKIYDFANGLRPHYETAKKMLGVTKNTFLGPADHLLKNAAIEFGVGETFYSTDVGVYFGKPGITVTDPFFDGLGPDRTGCTLCGGCMIGCSVGAKNTLVKNYLYFAKKNGVEILAETLAESVVAINHDPNGKDGYFITTKSSTSFFNRRTKTLKARGIIFSGGVLGTNELLLKCKQKKTLPNLSDLIGKNVRTNSESIIGVRLDGNGHEMDKGIAIGSGIYIDDETHIEAVRYPKNSNALSLICSILPNSLIAQNRINLACIQFLKKPFKSLIALSPIAWAKSTIILLVMQTKENSINLKLKKYGLSSEANSNQSLNPFIPDAIRFAFTLATKIKKGIPLTSVPEMVMNVPTTAHILGGCNMGLDTSTSIINFKNEVHNYNNLYICDGSAVSVNLGVNPSLTITAMTEHAMSFIPNKNVINDKT